MWCFGEDSNGVGMEAPARLLNIFVGKFMRSSKMEKKHSTQSAELPTKKLNVFMPHIWKLILQAGWQRRAVVAIERKKCAKRSRRCGFVLPARPTNGLVGKKIWMLTRHITTQCIASSVNGSSCFHGALEHMFICLCGIVDCE